MRKIKIKSILAAVAGLFLATSCSSSFLDTDPTDAVSSEKVPVPENAAALVNGAWYNLFDYSSTYANIGYPISFRHPKNSLPRHRSYLRIIL